MKMVKSLLLGSAAGLVAVSAGQAADLPVKAKPVEYVKVCSLYGAGFYYMPGTDLCIKVGGWVRGQAITGNTNGTMTWGPFAGVSNQRGTSNTAFKARGYITADVRNQTEYGTVRGYIAVGLNTTDVGLQVANLVDSANRAFVQWAGMTAGVTQSFYDFFSAPAVSYTGFMPASDTGDSGWFVWAYTAQLGGGFSATVSEEARRTTQIVDQLAGGLAATGGLGQTQPGTYASTVAATGGAIFPNAGDYGGQQVGDIVANLRVDQAWGSAQVMGAAHEVNAGYYSTTLGTAGNPSTGHPSDAWGWAAGAGLKLNLPMITQGDWFQVQFNATEGALRYLFQTPNTNWGAVYGSQEAYGVMSDCVYGGTVVAGTATGCQLTSAWGFNASFEHFWTPALHTALYGYYDKVSYGTSANAMLCTEENNGAGSGSTAVAAAGCNNNWTTWGVGGRTQWDVTKTFYLGVDVLYQDLQSASPNATNTLTGNTALVSSTVPGPTTAANEHSIMVSVRAHRDFLP
jgi:hypothetical protein